MNGPPPAARRKSGQALLESCFVIAVLALVLFGLLELVRLQASRAVLEHAAAAGARAQTVGFNNFMVFKAVRVASIPNAGLMTSPGYARPGGGPQWGADSAGDLWDYALQAQPGSPQYEIERSRIPLFLGAEHMGQLHPILDYTRWDDVFHSAQDAGGSRLGMTVRQRVPLVFPFSGAFYADGHVRQDGAMEIENHYPAFLE